MHNADSSAVVRGLREVSQQGRQAAVTLSNPMVLQQTSSSMYAHSSEHDAQPLSVSPAPGAACLHMPPCVGSAPTPATISAPGTASMPALWRTA
jgi:hypothetical protein